jgi:hypothetical protein
VDSDGRLWVATFSGVASLDAENPNAAAATGATTDSPEPQKDATKDTPPETPKPRQWKPLPLPLKPRTPDEDKVALSPQSQAVLSLCTDTKGRVWMGTRTEGIFRCDPKAGTWERLGRKEGLPDMFVRCLAMDSAGFLWAGTYGGGIAVFEPEELRFQRDDLVLDYRDSSVWSSRGWVYRDRTRAASLATFILGRRLRKAQADHEGKALCLYFDGPEGVNALGATPSPTGTTLGSVTDYRGVVLLNAETGETIRGWELTNDRAESVEKNDSALANDIPAMADLTLIAAQETQTGEAATKPPSGGDEPPEIAELTKAGTRARFLNALSVGQDRGIGPVFSLAEPTFYVRTEDGLGATLRAEQNPQQAALLFDGNVSTRPWRTPAGMLGWSGVLEFGGPVELEGVVVCSAPDGPSAPVSGLCLEAWDGKAKRWQWVGAVCGDRNARQVIVKRCATNRVRLGVLARDAVMSEIIVYAKAASEKIE